MAKQAFLLFIFFISHTTVSMASDAKIPVLPIYLFELKPLVYEENNKIQGAWYERFEALKKLAGLEFQYQFVSISRMELILSSQKPGCNLTLLKTRDRVEKMKINFIVEHPEKSILRIYSRPDDRRDLSIKALKASDEAKIATNTSAGIEALKELGIKSELLFNLNSIVRMLLIKRVDVMVASNLAIEKMDEFKSGKIIRGPVIKTLLHGIGCSRGTDPAVIEKLQKAAKMWRLE